MFNDYCLLYNYPYAFNEMEVLSVVPIIDLYIYYLSLKTYNYIKITTFNFEIENTEQYNFSYYVFFHTYNN